MLHEVVAQEFSKWEQEVESLLEKHPHSERIRQIRGTVQKDSNCFGTMFWVLGLGELGFFHPSNVGGKLEEEGFKEIYPCYLPEFPREDIIYTSQWLGCFMHGAVYLGKVLNNLILLEQENYEKECRVVPSNTHHPSGVKFYKRMKAFPE